MTENCLIGTILVLYGSKPLVGTLPCDGRSLNKKKYENLYRIIGKNFGSHDSDSFCLPDLRTDSPYEEKHWPKDKPISLIVTEGWHPELWNGAEWPDRDA